MRCGGGARVVRHAHVTALRPPRAPPPPRCSCNAALTAGVRLHALCRRRGGERLDKGARARSARHLHGMVAEPEETRWPWGHRKWAQLGAPPRQFPHPRRRRRAAATPHRLARVAAPRRRVDLPAALVRRVPAHGRRLDAGRVARGAHLRADCMRGGLCRGCRGTEAAGAMLLQRQWRLSPPVANTARSCSADCLPLACAAARAAEPPMLSSARPMSMGRGDAYTRAPPATVSPRAGDVCDVVTDPTPSPSAPVPVAGALRSSPPAPLTTVMTSPLLAPPWPRAASLRLPEPVAATSSSVAGASRARARRRHAVAATSGDSAPVVPVGSGGDGRRGCRSAGAGPASRAGVGARSSATHSGGGTAECADVTVGAGGRSRRAAPMRRLPVSPGAVCTRAERRALLESVLQIMMCFILKHATHTKLLTLP